MSEFLFGLMVGSVLGAAIALLAAVVARRPSEEMAREVVEQSQADRIAELDRIVSQLKESFGALSREALAGNSADFLRLAELRLERQTAEGAAELDGRKQLIDAQLEMLGKKVGKLSSALRKIEKARSRSFGELGVQLENVTRVSATLQQTTAQLTAVLASPSQRGQWGERMAEDVLRWAGLIEGVNYRKQALTDTGSKPDFVFLLPRGPRVNMDVKFPLSGYLRYLECEGEGEAAERHLRKFMGDVRQRVREVTTRDYIDASDGTLSFVLLFIPNEKVYSFIHECDPQLLEFALRRNVVLCSPLSLFAILAIVRQASDSFRLEETSREIRTLLEGFRKQWTKYGETVERMGAALDRAQEAYQRLTTTRARLLEKQLSRIDQLQAGEEGDGG